MFWVGLDLHKRYIAACALDDASHVVAEQQWLAADIEALVRWLLGSGGEVTVAMEATLYWAWLHDQLSAACIAAVTAHPYQVKLIWQARCKDVREADARLPSHGLHARRSRIDGARPCAHRMTLSPRTCYGRLGSHHEAGTIRSGRPERSIRLNPAPWASSCTAGTPRAS